MSRHGAPPEGPRQREYARFVKQLGEQVRSARERAGLTQEQLAARTGLERSTIAKIESGHPPSFDGLVAIARALVVPTRDLFG